jgi:hypothetical protein
MNMTFRGIKITEWTSFTTLGLAGGLIAGILVGMPLGQVVNAMIVTAVVTGLVGAVLGTFQAISLRRLLPKPLWWILATIFGLGIGLAAAVAAVEQVGILITGERPHLVQLGAPMRALSFVAVGLVAGTLLGAAQALVFRRQMPRIKHWIPASAIGLAVAFSVSSLAVDLSGLRFASAAGLIVFLLLSGISFGAVTSWPLRHA